MQITNHTELLNALILKYNLKSYLELGIQNPANNFDKIKCENKLGCDPELQTTIEIAGCTSDEFFEKLMPILTHKVDLIFIDGLHHADQVKRDFENSLRCLSDNGFIVVHDVLPENEAGTKVPRETKQWWGDVYKWAMTLNQYNDIGFVTFSIDNGCTLVWKMKGKAPAPLLTNDFNWKTYKEIGSVLLNVTNDITI